MTMIAALFVDPNGCYQGVPGVDLWDEQRDARRYGGNDRVIAHPPCARWCRLAGFTEAVFGYKRGEDGGCFASALESVRRYGGVLEHPAYSGAWAAFGLNHPPNQGGWVAADWDGGWTCYIEQGRYGHVTKKATWLYAHSVDLPSLEWGHKPDCIAEDVPWTNNRGLGYWRVRVSAKAAISTPIPFRDALLAMVRR